MTEKLTEITIDGSIAGLSSETAELATRAAELGFDGVLTPELHELSKEDEWDEMTELVTDEMVQTFAIDAPPNELADESLEKYGGTADRLQFNFDGGDYWRAVLEDLRSA